MEGGDYNPPIPPLNRHCYGINMYVQFLSCPYINIGVQILNRHEYPNRTYI